VWFPRNKRTIGDEILNSSGQVCAAQAKTSFSEDVMPIFVGRCSVAINRADREMKRAGSISAPTKE